MITDSESFEIVSKALEFLIEAHERSVGGRAQEIRAVLLQAHSGEKGERSVPGRTRSARFAQGACTVSPPWWSSTLKLMTVSQRVLGARRTLVRSSLVRGTVIMIVQPSSNRAHRNP